MRSAGTGAQVKSSEGTIPQREEFAYPKTVWRCRRTCRDAPSRGWKHGWGQEEFQERDKEPEQADVVCKVGKVPVSQHCSSCSDTELITAPPENPQLGLSGRTWNWDLQLPYRTWIPAHGDPHCVQLALRFWRKPKWFLSPIFSPSWENNSRLQRSRNTGLSLIFSPAIAYNF